MTDYTYPSKKWWEDKHAPYEKRSENPEALAGEMARIKEQIADLENQYSAKSKHLLGLLKGSESKTVVFYRNGRRFVAKLVEGTRTVVNEDKLKELIPASVWEKLLSSKVDQTKLTRAITSGEVDSESVAEAVAIVPTAPYWKFTEKKQDGKED